MCGRYVVKNPVTKTNKLVKSAIQVEDTENYNAHPYQKLPVIKKYKNGNTLEHLQWGLVPIGWLSGHKSSAVAGSFTVSLILFLTNSEAVSLADLFNNKSLYAKR